MGFLNNSGDIILDAVLTDEGRRRLAKGDGSFAIRKFALGDEEINYGLYDLGQSTAYQDLSILQTPCLEAFTNNTSTMKTKLITLTDNNSFYLPILKLNQANLGEMHADGHFIIAVDGNSEDNNKAGIGNYTSAIGVDSTGRLITGVIWGQSSTVESSMIRVDAGLDTNQIPPSTPIESYAAESAYIVEMDNRLGYIVSKNGNIQRSPDSIDDDNVATYSFTSTGGGGRPLGPTIGTRVNAFVRKNTDTETSADQAIAGPRSTILEFKIASSANLRQSSYLFTLLGASDYTLASADSTNDAIKYIDSIVKVTGLTTGYSVDIPIRYVKI